MLSIEMALGFGPILDPTEAAKRYCSEHPSIRFARNVRVPKPPPLRAQYGPTSERISVGYMLTYGRTVRTGVWKRTA